MIPRPATSVSHGNHWIETQGIGYTDLFLQASRVILMFKNHLSSVHFSHSIMSDSLQPHGLQHTMPLCQSPTPGAYSNSCLLSHPTISSSAASFSFCLQSFPTLGPFPVSQLFTSGGQGIGALFNFSPSNDYSGLISSRIDWFDLLAIQGTL